MGKWGRTLPKKEHTSAFRIKGKMLDKEFVIRLWKFLENLTLPE